MIGTPLELVGIGLSDIARTPGTKPASLLAQAMNRALEDASVPRNAVTAVLVNSSPVASPEVRAELSPGRLQEHLGLEALTGFAHIEAEGASLVAMLRLASATVGSGSDGVVACVFVDTPISGAGGGGQAFSRSITTITGDPRWDAVLGVASPASKFALVARRYLYERGAESSDLWNVLASNRRWACLNPLAMLRTELTVDEYHGGRMIADPLRIFDCAYPVNGAVVVLVGARDTRRAESHGVAIVGLGQGRARWGWRPGSPIERTDAAANVAREALAEAGVTPSQIDLVQVYDPFSFVAPLLLEAYGFADPGTGLKLYESGRTSPGGDLPVNTGGGQTASYYLQGFTPLHEAFVQLRGAAGDRQVDGASTAFVGLVGGILEHHGVIVLTSPDGGAP